jgi:peptide deformylase
MAIRKVARMGHPVLRKKARELSKSEILSESTRNLVRDMVETMNEYGGIGIAAPQIHESLSIAIIDYQEDDASDQPLTVVINPKITVLDSTEQGNWEGCLSVPELRGLVYRPRKVQIDFLDMKAQPQTIVAEDFLAIVFQHELDHLFGVLFVDRVRFEPGKSPISFTEEYSRYHAPEEDDDVGELED